MLHQSQICNVGVTRAQAKLEDEPSLTLSTLPFYDSDLDKGAKKFQHTVIKPSDQVAPDLPLGFKVPSNILQLQQDELTLVTLFVIE